MATVTKRKWTYKGEEKTAYIVRYTDLNGKRQQETFKLFKPANAFRIKIESELEQRVHVARSDTWTFAQANEEYMADCERRFKAKKNMGRANIITYESMARVHLLPEFGAMKMSDINGETLRAFFDRKSEKYKPNTVDRMRGQMQCIFQYAVQRQKAPRNPMDAKGLRAGALKATRVEIPSKQDIETILRYLDDRQHRERTHCWLVRRAAIKLALFCGMRAGEICGLLLENIDFEKRTITIKHSLSRFEGLKSPKTAAGVRRVPFPTTVEEDLLALKERRGDTPGTLFLSRTGRAFVSTDINRLWQKTAKGAGLADAKGLAKYSFHKFRHAAASLAIEAGLPVMHVKTMMGHSKVSTTIDTYGHLFPEDTRIATTMQNVAAQFCVAQESSKSP